MKSDAGRDQHIRARNLSEAQKRLIARLVSQPLTDRQIAEASGATEHQVIGWRNANGIRKERVGHQGDYLSANRNIRPKHIRGDYGDEIWYATGDQAFQSAMTAELIRREAESFEKNAKNNTIFPSSA